MNNKEQGLIVEDNVKTSDRGKYNPDGPNRYTAPKFKPPRRFDPNQRHKTQDDPLENKDKKMEEKLGEIIDDMEKIAKIVITAKANKEVEQVREGIENFKFQDNGIKAIAHTYKFLAQAFMQLVKASNIFSSCKSSQISPDGKLGGKGYIKPIKEIREDFSTAINILSELIDTFHDEVNSPYWKKTTIEDNPLVKDILSEADQIIDKAEEIEEEKKEGAKPPILSDEEKEKVKAILKSKNWF